MENKGVGSRRQHHPFGHQRRRSNSLGVMHDSVFLEECKVACAIYHICPAWSSELLYRRGVCKAQTAQKIRFVDNDDSFSNYEA